MDRDSDRVLIPDSDRVGRQPIYFRVESFIGVMISFKNIFNCQALLISLIDSFNILQVALIVKEFRYILFGTLEHVSVMF